MKKVKKWFRKSLKKGKSDEMVNPLKAWTLGLFAATAVFLAGAIFSALDFYFQLVSPPEPMIEEKPLIYKEHEVREFAEEYRQKAQDFSELRSQAPDPLPIEPAPEEDGETVAEEPSDG